MANHRIDIDPMDPKSIDQAVKDFNKISKDLDKKIDRFIAALVKIGKEAAKKTYGGAISVTSEQTGDTEWVIKASGEAVVFFEFGAGSATDAGHRYAGEMGFPVHRGSYSEENGGMYQATGYRFWVFGGRPYTEVRQRPGMLRAYEAIKQAIPETAKRIFG